MEAVRCMGIDGGEESQRLEAVLVDLTMLRFAFGKGVLFTWRIFGIAVNLTLNFPQFFEFLVYSFFLFIFLIILFYIFLGSFFYLISYFSFSC